MQDSNPGTLCIILHYGDEAVTWDCVRSLCGDSSLDVLIADNDPEQSIAPPAEFRDRVRVYRTGGTAGFAEANNMAVRHGRGPYHEFVLILNNDTVVLDDAIEKLRSLLSDPAVGAVGPCMPYAGDPGKIWACGGVIEKSNVTVYGLKEVASPEPYDVDYLPGAAIMCSLDTWDRVGGLPEKYFLAYEEAEFAIEVKRLGRRVVVHPGARILHKVGMSSDRQPMYLYNSHRSRLRFGSFIRGRYTGFLVAAFWCLVGARRSLGGVQLFFHALWDELTGVPLDRSTLHRIKKRYENQS